MSLHRDNQIIDHCAIFPKFIFKSTQCRRLAWLLLACLQLATLASQQTHGFRLDGHHNFDGTHFVIRRQSQSEPSAALGSPGSDFVWLSEHQHASNRPEASARRSLTTRRIDQYDQVDQSDEQVAIVARKAREISRNPHQQQQQQQQHRHLQYYQPPESLMLYQSANRNEAEVETIYIRKGANGTLPCLSVSPADQQATMNKIEWFKEDKKLVESEARRLVAWNTKHTIAYLPETGALLFRGVSNDDSGEYHCVLTKTSTGESEDGIVRFYVQGK